MSETPRFHEYRLMKKYLQEYGGVGHLRGITSSAKDIQEFYVNTMAQILSREQECDDAYMLFAEHNWIREKRAFYNVYPAVVQCLRHTNIHLTPSQIVDYMPSVAICFAEGHEPSTSNGRIFSMLFHITPIHLDLQTGKAVHTPMVHLVFDRETTAGVKEMSHFAQIGDGYLDEGADSSYDKTQLVRIAVGVSLLASDPEFAERILLNRDRKRIDRLDTPEKMQLAVDRAIRNGRNGWTIGEHLEVSPHTRRPHFAIRWTGKGSTVPKLRPVKGCVVKRSRLYPIPTGYMDAKK